MASFDQSTPFLLLARIHVKPGCVEEYLELARVTDAAVQASEPGMIHHTFDQDPDDPQAFVWSEVYANDAAFAPMSPTLLFSTISRNTPNWVMASALRSTAPSALNAAN